jgi:ribosomal protein L37AE/L43A
LTRAPLYGDDPCMRFPWQPQVSTRTCARCGSTWHVPRSAWLWRSKFASRLVASAAVITGGAVEADPAAVNRTVDAISEKSRLAEARYQCPQCPADHVTRPASGDERPY